MAIEVSVNNKLHPKGKLISIPGVGAVPNGGSITVPDGTKTRNGRTLSEAFKNSKSVTVKRASGGSESEGGDNN